LISEEGGRMTSIEGEEESGGVARDHSKHRLGAREQITTKVWRRVSKRRKVRGKKGTIGIERVCRGPIENSLADESHLAPRAETIVRPEISRRGDCTTRL
jgi:hypothetical protein